MKLKIAQITPYYTPSIGGVSGVAKYLSEEVLKLGHDVDVITAHRDHKGRPKLAVPKYEIINGVKVHRYKSIFSMGHMSIFPALISHLIKYKYDIIHYHSYRHPLCDISAFGGKVRNSVNILHGHGPFFEPGEINKFKAIAYNSYDKIAKLTTLRWSDVIIALNSYEKSRYIRFGIKENKIIIVPNAAENICFDQIDPNPFISKYQLQEKKIILFVGILNSAKRPDLLALALPKIINEVPSAHLVLVGPDGGYYDKINIIARQLNLEQNITMTGPLLGIDKQMAYASANLFVLPSDLDAYPLVLAEAFAHGIPVVTTNARGPADIVNDGVNGYIIKKGDVNEIGEKSIVLLKNLKLHQEFSKSARQTALDNFSAQAITKRIETIYLDQLVKKR